MKPWEIISSETVFDTFWVKIHKHAVRLANGVELNDFYVIERRDFAVIFGLTPDNKVPLVRQYKHGVKDFLLELPAGFIEDNEDPALAARREFIEETGFQAQSCEPLGKLFVGPSNMKHTAYAYIARNAQDTGRQRLDQTEDIEVVLMPLDDVVQAVASGRINCMTSVAVTHLALAYLQNGNSGS
jgi:8-oxo-dGTP pyrophosphatase MutT (NUDIX family)